MDDTFVDVPGHPGVKVECCSIYEDGTVMLSYIGFREEILALGIVTPETLEPWRKSQPKGKCDTQGDKIFLDRYYSVRGGIPRERFRVRPRNKSMERALLLPGAAEALGRHRAISLKNQREYNERNAAAVAEAIDRTRAHGRLLH